MNARVDAYFKVPDPETSSRPAPLHEVEDEDEDDIMIAATPSETSSEGRESVRQSSTSSQTDKGGLFTRMRRKSRKLSVNLFK